MEDDDVAIRLMTPEEVVERLQVPRSTLHAWRYRGEGPPSMRIGKHVRYDAEGLEHWLEEQAAKDRPRASGGPGAA